MGMQTVITIMNDGISGLVEDPQAGRKIHDAIMQASVSCKTRFSLASYGNVGLALPSHHVNVTQVIAAGQHTADLMCVFATAKDQLDPEVVLRCLADALGYKVKKL